MKYIKQITAILAVLCMFCALSAAAYAHEIPDLTKRGSIRIELAYGGKAVSGGKLRAYHVATITENDGDYRFQTLTPYKGEKLTQKNLDSPELAEAFAGQVSGDGIAPASSKDGVTCFENLIPGLYLIVQTEAATGYSKARAFLVTLPFCDEGHYIYDVDATVKAELEPEISPSPSVSPSPSPSPGTSETKLPQTGQLNWPIPVLAVIGLGMFSLGWNLRFGKKKDDDEK